MDARTALINIAERAIAQRAVDGSQIPMPSQRLLLTIAEAAEAMGVSKRHIQRLINEADANRKSRWRWGRELIDLSPVDAQRRTVPVNVAAVVPSLRQ
jgi:excisionase family DNA binding protein